MPFKNEVRKLIDTAELPCDGVIFRTTMDNCLLENLCEEDRRALQEEVPLFIEFIEDWGDLVVLGTSGEVKSVWWKKGSLALFKELVENAELTDVFDTNAEVVINDESGSKVVKYRSADTEVDFESGIKAKGIAALLFTPLMYDLSKTDLESALVKVTEGKLGLRTSVEWHFVLNAWLQAKTVDNAFKLGAMVSMLAQTKGWQDILGSLTMANMEPSELRGGMALFDLHARRLLKRRINYFYSNQDSAWHENTAVVRCFENASPLDPLSRDKGDAIAISASDFLEVLRVGSFVRLVFMEQIQQEALVSTCLQDPLYVETETTPRLINGDDRETNSLGCDVSDITTESVIANVINLCGPLEDVLFLLPIKNYNVDTDALKPVYGDLSDKLCEFRRLIVTNTKTSIENPFPLGFRPFNNPAGVNKKIRIAAFSVTGRSIEEIHYEITI